MERYFIDHLTVYDYEGAVSVAQQLVRLQPRTLPWQRCLAFELGSDPQPQSRLQEYDYFGNAMLTLCYAGAHQRLSLRARSTVEVGMRPWANEPLHGSPAWEDVRDLAHSGSDVRTGEFCFPSPLLPPHAPATAFARASFTARRPLLDACHDLMQRLHTRFSYVAGQTDSNSTVAQVWDSGKGVCQDFAHIMITALRGLGLPARYVSGYVRTEPPRGQQRLVGADASHAWVAVWCPRLGWVEFDPTNARLADEHYVVLGWGRDFTDISPVRGVITGAAAHRLTVEVTVWPEGELQDAAAPQLQSNSVS